MGKIIKTTSPVFKQYRKISKTPVYPIFLTELEVIE